MSLLAKRIKELRIEKKAKQMDIADYLGVNPRAIRFYESGDREPNVDTLIKLADFFDVSVDYLIGREK